MKTLRIFLVITVACVSSRAPKVKYGEKYEQQRFYIKSVQCNSTERIVHQNMSCRAKSFNRTYSTGTFIAYTKMPIHSVFLSCAVHFRYGLIYREVLRTPLIDVCLLMEMGTTHLLIGLVLQIFKDSVPEVVHLCPYDNIDIRNRSINTKSFPHIFPSGDYKIFFQASTNNETIGHVLLVASLISSNKDTFG